MRTRVVEANGIRFEVLEEGDGDRLALLLHGFPEHAVSWRHQMAPLASLGFRVWAVNLRGYGRTTRLPGLADYALPVLLADVAALINAATAEGLGSGGTVLVGHDWGGVLAWCVAALRLRPLDRLAILNAPHPVRFRAALRRPAQLRKSWYMALFQLPWLPERLLVADDAAAIRRMFAGLRLPPAILATYTRQITEPGAATAMLNWYRAARRPISRVAGLGRVIETPTLVIWGERDVALDLACLDGLDRHVRHLTIRRLPGISHWVQQEAPEAVNAALCDFLR